MSERLLRKLFDEKLAAREDRLEAHTLLDDALESRFNDGFEEGEAEGYRLGWLDAGGDQ